MKLDLLSLGFEGVEPRTGSVLIEAGCCRWRRAWDPHGEARDEYICPASKRPVTKDICCRRFRKYWCLLSP